MSNLIPVEFNNQRIMTTKQLAEAYGTREENIKTNFNRNLERFIKGKHYYQLIGDELQEFKRVVTDCNDPSIKFASVLNLWTERGAARHAKILQTDEAWEVYEQLEETYFRVKDQKLETSSLSPELQMFNNLFKALAKQELEQKQIVQAVQETKEEVQAIRNVVAINANAWKSEVTNLLNKIAKEHGGTAEAYRDIRNESYKLLNERAGANLDIRLINRRRKVLEETGSKSKANKISKLDVIADDKRLTEIYLAIVKELAIKYKVA